MSSCSLAIGCVVISGLLPSAPVVVGTFFVTGLIGAMSSDETANELTESLGENINHSLGLPPPTSSKSGEVL